AAHGAGRRIGREAAELPIQADRTQEGRTRDLIVGDVVDLERAGIDVAQHEVGPASATDRGDACELPIQADRADEGGAGKLIVVDVLPFQPAGPIVAQDQIAFAGDAAEIADARELPIEADRADEGRAGERYWSCAESCRFRRG